MRKLLALAGFILLLIGAWAAWREVAAVRAELAQGYDVAQADFVGSESCVSCHVARHASWHRTFHRSMTQEATPASVQGRFDGQPLRYWGTEVRPITRNGRYYFEYRDGASGAPLNTLEVLRTVGSHRYQQYLTRDDHGTYYRLHYLWHMGDRRWVHMNAAFLGPDQQHFDAPISVWNNNCIFCHNTGPNPGMSNLAEIQSRAARGESIDMQSAGRYRSEVAELGISCESCHGPASEHIARNQAFWRRMTLSMDDRADPTIVNPSRLSPERSTQVCGQCHGQRVPAELRLIADWMQHGLNYRAGQDLNAHQVPVTRDTLAPGPDPNLFKPRFWDDGTARLSAYEYQGLLQSRCYLEGELSCINCHTMHGGDPSGQIPARNRGNAPCLRCHQDYAKDLSAHTQHDAASAASNCYTCHMPRIAYGVMTVHRSHRIERPDPAANAAAGRPNACNLCHLDKSPQWAAEQKARLWGVGAALTQRADGADPGLAELPASLLAGDPLQKAMHAYAAAEPAGGAAVAAGLIPWLLVAMSDDYPAVRRFAWASLIELDGAMRADETEAGLSAVLAEFDFIGDPALRAAQLKSLWAAWRAADKSRWPAPDPSLALTPEYEPEPEVRARLLELGAQQRKQINVGE